MKKAALAVVVLTVLVVSAALLAFFPGAAYAEAVSIYGLPLGGKITPAPRQCKEFGVDGHPNPCWVGPPFTPSRGGKYGSFSIPDDRLPSWAAYASHKIFVDGNWILQSITTETNAPDDFDLIKTSISSRFGRPTPILQGLINEVEWEGPDVYVRLVEYGDKCCEISFMTPKAIADHREYLKKQAQKKASRPVSP